MPSIGRLVRPAAFACCLLAAPLAAYAQVDDPNEPAAGEKARWSLGLGVMAMRLPDYRGSDESRNLVLPFPSFLYRSHRLQASRDSIRAELFEGSRFELDLSLAGSLPVRSDGNKAREGMPDLDPTVEFGPSLNAWLWRGGPNDGELSLRMPLRAGMNFDRDGLHMRGWQFGPRLYWRVGALRGLEGWRMSASGGPLWGSRRWHDYFYGVAPEYARSDRPAYAAKGGYAGLQGSFTVSRTFGLWSVLGFVRADSLHGASFENSPLVKQTSNVSVGFGVSRTFWQSTPPPVLEP